MNVCVESLPWLQAPLQQLSLRWAQLWQHSTSMWPPSRRWRLFPCTSKWVHTDSIASCFWKRADGNLSLGSISWEHPALCSPLGAGLQPHSLQQPFWGKGLWSRDCSNSLQDFHLKMKNSMKLKTWFDAKVLCVQYYALGQIFIMVPKHNLKIEFILKRSSLDSYFRSSTDWFCQSFLQPARTDRQRFSKVLRRPHSYSQLCICSQTSELII